MANTRKLLLTAAAIMSVMLIVSSLVTTLLIEPADYQEGGKAAGRAIAFLAHRYLGPAFGTVYDLSTIFILGLAGASAMAGLLHLIPRYLPRYGMAPRWAALSRPLVLVLLVVAVIVTLIFQRGRGGAKRRLRHRRARVDPVSRARGHARALARAAVRAGACTPGFLFLVFAYTLADNCIERPDGLIIGSIFTVLLMLACGVSRSMRSMEIRIPYGFFVERGELDTGTRSSEARRSIWFPSRRRRRTIAAGREQRSLDTSTCVGRFCSCTSTCSTIAASSRPRSK